MRTRAIVSFVGGTLLFLGRLALNVLDSVQALDYFKHAQPDLYAWIISPGVGTGTILAGVVLMAFGGFELYRYNRRRNREKGETAAHNAERDLAGGGYNILTGSPNSAIAAGSYNVAVGGSGNTVTFTVLKREETENLTGWPRVVLSYQRGSRYGFHVTNYNSQVEARSVQLDRTNSPHYLLTSECEPLVTAGTPPVPLVLQAELITDVGAEEWIKHATGEEAWKGFAQDLWLLRQPKRPKKGAAVEIVRQIFSAMAQDFNTGTALVIPLSIG